MPNIELLEKSMPVAPIRIAALGCPELAQEVDRKLVKFRKELIAKKQLSIIPQGYSEESFMVECECPRFGTGVAKAILRNPFVVPTFLLWWMLPITVKPILYVAMKIICHRIIISRT